MTANHRTEIMRHTLGIILTALLLGALAALPASQPTGIRTSSPVNLGETVMLFGNGFGTDATVTTLDDRAHVRLVPASELKTVKGLSKK
jgi:ABC-type uncharacterized transport system permease subunit